jgi:hypothetical protein
MHNDHNGNDAEGTVPKHWLAKADMRSLNSWIAIIGSVAAIVGLF